MQAIHVREGDLVSQMAESRAALAKARQRRLELELRLTNLASEVRQRAGGEHQQSVQRLEELDARLRTAQDAAGRQDIRSPVAGRVIDLRVTASGLSVLPRETVMQIVPTGERLIVEACRRAMRAR